LSRLVTTFLAVFCVTSAFAGDGAIRRFPHPVKDQYIVALDDTLTPQQVRALAGTLSHEQGGKLGHIWDSVVPGFVVDLPEAAAIAISRHPMVRYVEEVAYGEISQLQSPAPWHLDRIDQRYMPLDGNYWHNCNYTPVYAYVVDTGVRSTHQEFGTISDPTTSRVIAGYNARAGLATWETQAYALNPCQTEPANLYPCGGGSEVAMSCVNGGHGTSVASLIGGRVHGASKGSHIISVRTHSCLGASTTAIVSNGLQWIYNDKPSRNGAGLVNMSFAFEVATSTGDVAFMEEWINKLINERSLTAIAAAGNSNSSIANYSPARMARGRGGKVITVGGTTNAVPSGAVTYPADRRWKCNPANAWEINNPTNGGGTIPTCSTNLGSNYGADIFAPAQNVLSAHMKEDIDLSAAGYDFQPSDTAIRPWVRSGTSFSAAIVSGMVSRALVGSLSTRTPDDIWQLLSTEGTAGLMDNPNPAGSDPNAFPVNGSGCAIPGDCLSSNLLLYRQGSTRCR
jgi:hypothetical protein